MKKNNLLAIIAAALFTNLFFSCQKENSFGNPVFDAQDVINNQQHGQQKSREAVSATTTSASLTYSACGSLLNIYDPQPGKYALGMSYGSSYKNFGIPGAGVLNFNFVDMVDFEFSGRYADAARTIKLYRVHRSDGKYLTFHLYLDYFTRIQPGQGEEQQLWIINNLGKNRYNLIITQFSTNCWLARTYQDNDVYRIGVASADDTAYPGSTIIYITPTTKLPPVTK